MSEFVLFFQNWVFALTMPFVAFTRSESFARTALHKLTAWGDFAKGASSEVHRLRLDLHRLAGGLARRERQTRAPGRPG